jgi:hypothetical protein
MSFALHGECLGLSEAPRSCFPPRIGRFPAVKFALKPEQKRPGGVFVPGARRSARAIVPTLPEGFPGLSAAGMAGLGRLEDPSLPEKTPSILMVMASKSFSLSRSICVPDQYQINPRSFRTAFASAPDMRR